jgi:hypothetical protein
MTKVRPVYWPIARTTESISALTKFSITLSSAGASVPDLPLAGALALVCAQAGGAAGVNTMLNAQASAISRDSERPPARFVVRPLVMSATAEVQKSPIAIAPPQQRDEARQLRFHTGIGARQSLSAARKA